MISVCKPLLPDAESLLPYLKRIDETRQYTNFGPLVSEYEARLSEHFGGYVVATCSGTQALVATLLALNMPKERGIRCPAYTFVATAAAIVTAGYTPYFTDIGEESDIGVYPFGVPCVGDFSLIDAAAGFDTVKVSSTPTIVSTHATKPFSTGEGGFVLCSDKNLIDEIRVITNHGISKNREVNVCGINGKMSEYNAAIGLASLDAWAETREKWVQVSRWYGRGDHAHSTHTVWVRTPKYPRPEKLREKGVDSRMCWYGAHLHKAYAHFPSSQLLKATMMVGQTISLPKFIDMTKDQVDYVVESFEESIRW